MNPTKYSLEFKCVHTVMNHANLSTVLCVQMLMNPINRLSEFVRAHTNQTFQSFELVARADADGPRQLLTRVCACRC